MHNALDKLTWPARHCARQMDAAHNENDKWSFAARLSLYVCDDMHTPRSPRFYLKGLCVCVCARRQTTGRARNVECAFINMGALSMAQRRSTASFVCESFGWTRATTKGRDDLSSCGGILRLDTCAGLELDTQHDPVDWQR